MPIVPSLTSWAPQAMVSWLARGDKEHMGDTCEGILGQVLVGAEPTGYPVRKGEDLV